jgi:hypothetical protein
MFPLRRQADLIIEQVADETLVYDKRNDRAHCLNRAAALVWQHCDGRTTVAQIAAVLDRELAIDPGSDGVRLALRQLDRSRLMDSMPDDHGQTKAVSRRELARRIGLAAGLAVALPLVSSIIAPTPLMAASCITAGSPCGGNNQNVSCCAGLQCQNNFCR